MIPSAKAAALRCFIVIGAMAAFVLISWLIGDWGSKAWATAAGSQVNGRWHFLSGQVSPMGSFRTSLTTNPTFSTVSRQRVDAKRPAAHRPHG